MVSRQYSAAQCLNHRFSESCATYYLVDLPIWNFRPPLHSSTRPHLEYPVTERCLFLNPSRQSGAGALALWGEANMAELVQAGSEMALVGT